MYIPLFVAGLSMVFSLMIIELTSLNFAYILGFAALLLIPFIWKQKTFVISFASIFLACLLFVLKTEFYLKPALSFVDEKVSVSGQIIEEEGKSDSGASRYIVKVKSGELKGYKIRLSSKYCDCKLNDFVSFSGKVYEMPERMRAKNIFVGIYTYDVETSSYSGDVEISWLRQKMEDARGYLERVLYSNLPTDYALVLLGMLVGDKSNFPEEIYENFQRSGVVHLLAVSGFHTSLWSMIVYQQLQKRVNFKFAAFVSIIFVLAFLGLTGFSKSATRASLMLLVFFFGRLLSLQPDSKNSLGFAAVVISVSNPFVGGDVGFLLSFFSTLGILTIFPKLNRASKKKLKSLVPNSNYRKRIESSLSTVLVTISTLLFTMPMIMLFIGELSLISPLTNLLITSAASAAIFLSGIGVMISGIPILWAFSKPIFLVSALLTKYILWVTRLMSSLTFASVDVSAEYMQVTVCAVLILIGFSLILRASTKRTILLSSMIFVLSIVTHYLVEYIELYNYL